MDNSSITISSNWDHIGGCPLSQSIKERAANSDTFIKPELNELVDEDNSILLSKEKNSEFCELYVKRSPHYKIQAISFVCNVVKVEIFQGPINEYMETIYGILVDEVDDLFKTYRYDVEIEKSGITDLTLRFLTDSYDVCVFGIILYTLPNPNGVTTLLPPIDRADTQNILQKSDTTPDKCEQILQVDKQVLQEVNTPRDDLCTTDRSTRRMFDDLKSYIDECFKEYEVRMHRCIAASEERQNQKLNKILNILENNK